MIVNADCLDYMRTMKADSVALTVTSPPYDNLRTYNGSSEFDFEGIAKELFRITTKGGVVVWVVGDATINGSETGTSFKHALFFKSVGFKLYDTMIYAKKNYMPKTHKRYEQAFEYMFVLSKGTPQTFNPIKEINKKTETWGKAGHYDKDGKLLPTNSPLTYSEMKIKSNIWHYAIGQEKNGHPAVFPIKLALDHIQSWSNPGDIVLDTFMGSGTTGVAAQQLGRQFIGIEKELDYFEIAKRRIEAA